MFSPDDIQKLKQQMRALKIDRATLEKAAQSLLDIPELRKVLEHQSFQEGFEGRVDELCNEVDEIFGYGDEHKEPPDG